MGKTKSRKRSRGAEEGCGDQYRYLELPQYSFGVKTTAPPLIEPHVEILLQTALGI